MQRSVFVWHKNSAYQKWTSKYPNIVYPNTLPLKNVTRLLILPVYSACNTGSRDLTRYIKPKTKLINSSVPTCLNKITIIKCDLPSFLKRHVYFAAKIVTLDTHVTAARIWLYLSVILCVWRLDESFTSIWSLDLTQAQNNFLLVVFN